MKESVRSSVNGIYIHLRDKGKRGQGKGTVRKEGCEAERNKETAKKKAK